MISSPHHSTGFCHCRLYLALGLLVLQLLAGSATGSLRGSVTTTNTNTNTNNNNGSFADTHGNLSQDWDARCPAQATALGHCVASSGGNLEICKGCGKMAAGMVHQDLAVEGCIEDKYMCNGCRNNLVAYFFCGTGRQQETMTTTTTSRRSSGSSGVTVAQTRTQNQQPGGTVAVHSTNTADEVADPVPAGITVHHIVHDQEQPSTNPNVPANHVHSTNTADEVADPVPAGMTVHHLVHDQEQPSTNLNVAKTQHATTNNNSNNNNGGSSLSHHWDLACPAHSYDLGNCVGNTGGSLELCKSCAVMASTLDSSEFALDACAEEPSMCRGCRNTLQTYYDCGLDHNANASDHDETIGVNQPNDETTTTVDVRPNHLHEEATTNIDPAHNNNNNNVNNNNNGSGGVIDQQIADDWDEACPVHAYDLETCVAHTGGILELCKSCAKMASTLDSSGFALDECAEEPTMCHGCRTSLQGYFECGVGGHGA